jgi:hypothetical protein
LLVTAGKLDWNTQKSRWFAALDEAGVVVPPRRWSRGNCRAGSSAGCGIAV